MVAVGEESIAFLYVMAMYKVMREGIGATLLPSFFGGLVNMSQTETREYSMEQRYQIGEVIEHPFFGKGKVIANLKKGKIEVNFEKLGVRTLVSNYKA